MITNDLKERLSEQIENLITNEKVDTFLFGSKSEFDDLCYDVVSQLKMEFPHIKRVYVRAAFADISDDYIDYLLKYYEETYYPEKLRGGRESIICRAKPRNDYP